MDNLIFARRGISAVVLPNPSEGKPYVWHANVNGNGWAIDCQQCGFRLRVERTRCRPMAVRCPCGHWIPAP